MGKIKIATLGSETEDKLREKKRVSREEKKKRKEASKVHISGMKGGQRVKAVGAQSEEELNKMAKLAQVVEKDQAEGIKFENVEDKAKKSAKGGSASGRQRKARSRSRKYQEALLKIDHNRLYPLDEALSLLRQISLTSFDGTVELHINTIEKGLRGTVSLPAGTGKKITVKIATAENIDKLIEEIGTGKLNFDALVAHPTVVGKLARVAKYLGPRGLMPNPKNGTISTDPEKVAKKLEQGEISWKTEADFPIIHQVIGKLSFKDSQLTENFQALINSINPAKIKNITLKSTMSPGIKVQVS